MKVVFQIAMASVELKSKRGTLSTAHNYRDIKLNFYLKRTTTLVLHFISMNTSMTVMFVSTSIRDQILVVCDFFADHMLQLSITECHFNRQLSKSFFPHSLMN